MNSIELRFVSRCARLPEEVSQMRDRVREPRKQRDRRKRENLLYRENISLLIKRYNKRYNKNNVHIFALCTRSEIAAKYIFFSPIAFGPE